MLLTLTWVEDGGNDVRKL